MCQWIFKTVCGKFPFDGISRTARSRSLGAASLDHKSPDHAMERKAVVEAFADQFFKIFNGLGRRLFIQTDRYITLAFDIQHNHSMHLPARLVSDMPEMFPRSNRTAPRIMPGSFQWFLNPLY
ncbi:hypothetical protein SDC9_189438 [bioreactor metagenome]|uniref:Uncharacterized protein n=1 Tax=bioreactor metagenome TaxID=1076179 RepID=A0A645I311_9ZZZZ